jgi:hypothetical protein
MEQEKHFNVADITSLRTTPNHMSLSRFKDSHIFLVQALNPTVLTPWVCIAVDAPNLNKATYELPFAKTIDPAVYHTVDRGTGPIRDLITEMRAGPDRPVIKH